MKDFFDRKTFDPINKPADLATLNILRGYGGGRRVESTALGWVWKHKPKREQRGSFVDLGCGDSRDYIFAKNKGFGDTVRVDLFPPHIDRLDITDHAEFMQGDIAEHIPLFDNSADVAINQAVLDLIEPVAREAFYREVYRILRPDGIFSCHIVWLQSGWGFEFHEEYERICKVFSNVKAVGSKGFVARKENL